MTLGLPFLGICALICVYALFAFRKARKEAPPANDARFRYRYTVWAAPFFGLMFICWIGISIWAMLAFNMTGRRDGPFVIIVVALLVAPVFGALFAIFKACGVKILEEIK